VIEVSVTKVLRLNESDAEQVHDLLNITWEDTYAGIFPSSDIKEAEVVWHSTETLRRQMRNQTVVFGGYKENGKLLGMVRCAVAEADTVRIFQLYVLPSSQRRGIGGELLDYAQGLFPDAKKFVLDVAKENEKGLAFFRRRGFNFNRESKLKVAGQEIEQLEGVLIV